jgi:branched-subunit amino acid aminotransferase/4-amino-4-deoxychorismate lyase
MEEVPQSCTVITCRTLGRSEPTVKSTNWIEERKEMKELIKGTDYNEVLLVDGANHTVLEGLSSNFGVLTRDGRLVTASDSLVLPGSVMKLVKQVCLELNVSIEERSPSIDEAADWQAAFISSTSRLVLPITQIFLDNTKDSIKIDSLSSSLLRRIQENVDQRISTRE